MSDGDLKLLTEQRRIMPASTDSTTQNIAKEASNIHLTKRFYYKQKQSVVNLQQRLQPRQHQNKPQPELLDNFLRFAIMN